LNEPKASDRENKRYLEIRKVTVIGAILDLGLGVTKIIFGLMGHSQGLVADGVHSLSDLATDGIVIFAAKHGTRAADAEHPYGHERIQTLATMLLGIALIIVALGLAYQSLMRITSLEVIETPSYLTIVVALVSILSKEWIFQYTIRVSRRVQSKLLQANAWHSRTDAFSSIVVLAGIVGTMSGFMFLDATASIIVSVMIVYVGGRFVWDSVHELIDTGLDIANLQIMRDAIMSVEGVRDIHQLRTRRMGPLILSDVHVTVESEISVSEGHRIGEEVEKLLLHQLSDQADITVHIDAECDEKLSLSELPLRGEIFPALKKNWKEISDAPIKQLTLHYIENKINIEFLISMDDLKDVSLVKSYSKQIQNKYVDDDEIGSVRFTISTI
jgi:cation diffusion facilitator family transporter